MLKIVIEDSRTGMRFAEATLSERINSVQAREIVDYLDDSHIVDFFLALPYASRKKILATINEIHATVNAIPEMP